jgi:hypothetical protein
MKLQKKRPPTPRQKILKEWEGTIKAALDQNGLSLATDLTESTFEKQIKNYSDRQSKICREVAHRGRVIARLSRTGCIYNVERFNLTC